MEKDGGVHKQCSKGPESACEREVRPCVVLLSSPRCLPRSATDKCQRYCGPAEALKSPMLFAEVTNPFMRRCWLLVTHTHKAHTHSCCSFSQACLVTYEGTPRTRSGLQNTCSMLSVRVKLQAIRMLLHLQIRQISAFAKHQIMFYTIMPFLN